ncbi:carbohydrate ABC transporter permease [Amycolatopsis regifaucium]|uniref:Sugar ABC transporter permease n=1 Tax=Amycolatopsis regifaucium TaxID=546365 RepID=A0A154MUQ4_9PSEU|nr:carbohydrate ABC transporter permease [Amycolatopsis regifaucium]KZB88015.1 sugar ABC transporter permease [Amycolatopsis regifaucium]OKA04482.1 sugar ABC transporter permease [Amycolatopsis regifaucium]SFH50092.1 cellobiose transport system permease protein [Amycolatopsis regifaucium]
MVRRRRRPGFLVYGALLAVVIGSVFPLYWSFVVSTRDGSAIAERTPPLIPGGHLLDNVREVFDKVDFWLAMQNSLIVSSTVTVSNVVLASLAGFAFARLRFRGRDTLFLLLVGTVMVPAQLGIIPLYMVVGELGWYGELTAVIVPGLVSAFSVFWMRQACEEAVPAELLDAATMDGCSILRSYWHVGLPAIRSQAAVLAMLTFMAAWNDFFFPLVVLDPHDSPTVQVALSTLASGYYTDYALMLTGATLGVLPVIVLFVLLARHMVQGALLGGPSSGFKR